ncbi:unnamed protein product [Brachionus calyciflorus]|uniref:Uncharacterized protein n=1 Tax=Brachionus calyciflorus TaxID=104777 RepID=A0A813M9X0_9BILA|nr:unnamed protein product [Brachionus calyciflorus]
MSNFRDPTDYGYLEQNKDFEQKRIKTLQQERVNVQKKTFTKWCNSFLSKHGMEIDNLFKDLEDGKRLIKLLEIISGEKLGKPNQGKLKVHKIENVNKALSFIQTKAKLESIGAEDIVSGNPTLILGLIWTIILRFQIQDIEIELEDETQEKRSAKEALLLWCQRRTHGYQGVKIVDFSNSWRNGLAFNALIHSQRPDLLDFNSINPSNNFNNLNNAFELAQKHLGIHKLLDPEDIDVDKPDEKSILTYVSSYYHTFAKMKTEAVGGKRIGKIVGFMMDIDRLKEAYEFEITSLLAWIQKNIKELSNFEFPNSLDGIKSLMLTFNKGYMAIEKPPKYKQKSSIEANFYSINMKLNAQRHPKYNPPEGKSINDLETAWSRLEKTEHERDLALKRELNRQEKLEQMYDKFDKKAKLREYWLSDMAKILSNSSSFSSSNQLDATFKKLEAISADFSSGSDRFKRLDQLANELIQEDYFSKDTVRKRNQQIQNAFNNLIDQFEKRKASMATFQELQFLFQEMESLKNEMLELEKSFQSKDYAGYLLAAEDLLTKHSLLESQIAGISQHLKSVNRRAQQFTRSTLSSSSTSSISRVPNTSSPNSSLSESPNKTTLVNESQLVKEKLDALNKAFELINVLSSDRRRYLLEQRDFIKFLEEADEEILWIQEKIQIVKSNDAGHDLASTQILLNKQEQLEDEIKFRSPRMDKIILQGHQIIEAKKFNKEENEKVRAKISDLENLFKKLKESAAFRRSLLEDALSSQQYYSDANEAESWMKDKMALVSLNSDCGKDEASAQALLNRHVRIQEEIKAYEPEIRRLGEFTDVLVGKRRFSSFPNEVKQQIMKNQKLNDETEDSESDLSITDSHLEETVDEIIEKEVTEMVTFQIEVQCVKALYPFQSKNFSLNRSEVLELKEKTNNEWWLLEKQNGQEGYAPANYVKELGALTLTKQKQQIVKRPEVIKVKKLVQNPINKPNKKASVLRRKPTTVQPRQLQHLNTENLQKRQSDISFTFNQLLNSSIERRKQLDNTITFYRWLRKYEEFSKWVQEKLQQMSINNRDSLLENTHSSKLLYQAFITDFLANQNEYSQIEKLSDELINKKLTYVIETSKKAMSHGEIKQKSTHLNSEWLKLLELKKYWDNSIKAFQCIEKFNSLYVEVSELVKEKLIALKKDEACDISDVKTVRALQKKQEKIEREIGHIEKNILSLKENAQEVCKYFPQEKINVEKKIMSIEEEWFKLKEDVKNRKAKLDENHGLQRFEDEIQDFTLACVNLETRLSELSQPRDLKQCDEMLKTYIELNQEFKNEILYKFDNLKDLAMKLLGKRGVAGSVEKINSSLNQVSTMKLNALNNLDDKKFYLEDFYNYLKFKQDASSLELLMQDQEAYLQFNDVGSSSVNVDALQKRHDEFVAKLNAQDDKMKNLTDQLNKLKNNKHFAINEMDAIFQNLTQKRLKLKQSALDRKTKLAKSKEFFEFKIQCDDLSSWINDKRALMNSTTNLEASQLSQIEKYMNKHEAIEKELISNRTRLDKLIVDGGRLSKSIVNEKVQELISIVEKNWVDLETESKMRGQQILEAKQKAELNLKLNDVDNRIKNLESQLTKNYATSDLRGNKNALKKHDEIEKQISVEKELLNDLNKEENLKLGERPHDSDEVKNSLKAYLHAFDLLNPMILEKKKHLQFEIDIQQLAFDLDEENKWIEQSLRQVDLMSQSMPQTLFEANNMNKKLNELDRVRSNKHKLIYDLLIQKTNDYLCDLSNDSTSLDTLKHKKLSVEENWKNLEKIIVDKKKLLSQCLVEQEQLEELNQVTIGLAEKLPIIKNSLNENSNEITTSKNITKLNQLSHDLDEYSVLLDQKKPCSSLVQIKLKETKDKLKEMQIENEEKKKSLSLKLEALEFDRESTEFMKWINEKRVQAQSEEYGQDFEHLILINEKFIALNDEIKLGDNKYERLRKRASDLLNFKSADSKIIHKRNDEVKNNYEMLLSELKQRELLLQSAAEIHRFNKDVQDLNRRIGEKEASFVVDLGRDLNSCETLVRKHSTFMEELSALKFHLNDLNKESEVLRAKHPGDTEETIISEMNDLIDRFNNLRLKSEKRTRDLNHSCSYFKFTTRVKDINRWMAETKRSLLTYTQPLDLYSVTQLKEELNNLSLEMSQRDDVFKNLEDMCIEITSKKDHPNSKEIVTTTNECMNEREYLFQLWILKNKVLDSQSECHEFYREVNQLVSLINSQESLLTKSYNELEQQLNERVLLNVDDLESILKTHGNLEKKIEKQSLDRAIELKKKGSILLEKESLRLNSKEIEIYDSSELKRIQEILNLILKKENDLRELCQKRNTQLRECLQFFKLRRDIEEFEIWIDDRIRHAKTLCQKSQFSSLNEKVKLFQKQKALRGEIELKFVPYNDLNQKAKEQLVTNKTVKHGLIKQTIEDLNKKWQDLAYEIMEREKEFEEAKDILEFNDELEKLEDWLKSKELMIQNGDTGRDYEHCISLLKKAEETLSPSHEKKLQEVILKGDKLVSLGRTDRDLVLEKKDRLINRSCLIKNGIDQYHKKLVIALEIHLLMRDYDDLDQRIKEKISILQVDSELKTLDAVQVAQSKVNDLRADLDAIEDKLTQTKAETLKVPNNTTLLQRLVEIEKNWLELKNFLEKKSIKLDSSYHYQKFMVEYRDLKSWIWDMGNRIQQQGEPLSLSEAETAINLHQERMTEIEGRNHRFISLRDMGSELIQRQNSQKEVSNFLKDIHQLQIELEAKALDKQKWLQQCADYQDIKESWRQIENWSRQVEVSLKSSDVGDSVLAVKSLLTKHENIENSIKSQMASHGSFDNLEERAQEMIRQKYSHSELIQKILNDSEAKRKELSNLSLNRRKQLDDSLMYQNLLLNYYDVLQWIKEKTVTSMEKSYLDLTNLQTKIQRHQAFLIDLSKVGQKRVEDIHKEAAVLLSRHQTTLYSLSVSSSKIIADIEEHIKDLDSQWNALKTAAENKGKCLNDAHKNVLFTRFCDDLFTWFDEVESQLSSDDNGHDISSCKMLLLRHETLSKQIDAQKEKLIEVDNYLLNNKDNFMLKNIQELASQVKERYSNLKEPCSIRLENLQESLSLFTVLHDLNDADLWIQDKLPLANLEDLGFNLEETRKLVKKHENLEQETLNQNNFIESVFKSTKQLIDRKHYAHTLLSTRLSDLEKEWLIFRDLISERKSRLENAFEVQKFYSDSDETIQFMKEKLTELTNPDYGRNELISLSFLKKLKSLDTDLKTNQKSKINSLIQQASDLQLKKFSDKKTILRKQTELETLYNKVTEACKEREEHLNAMLKVFEYERECEALTNWLKDQELIAKSEDFGQDLEHAETLAKKLQQFINYLEKNSEKINKFDDMAQRLCENKYTPNNYIEFIDERCSFITKMWNDLNLFTEIRRKTLEHAIEVHAFDKDCGDLMAWASEKEKFLSQEDIGYDLASVYTLAKQQEALENELTSLGEELERLNSESTRLIQTHPATKEHVENKLEEAETKYNEVLQKLSLRKDKIQNSQNMFVYANEFNELSEWLREMLEKLTSVELTQQNGLGEVNNAEMLIKKHKESKIEIDLQQPKIQKFLIKSDELLAKTKVKSQRQEILSKIQIIQNNNKNLLDTWVTRQDLYEQNLEYNKLLREIKLLDAWLSSKDSYVHTDILGDSVTSVEALLKQHEDFERMLHAMESRFGNLRNENKLEKKLKEIKEREAANRLQADAQLQEEKKKDAERKRKLEQRRQDDRRRTQEIIAIVSNANNQVPSSQIAANVSQSVGSIDATTKTLEIKTQFDNEQFVKPINSPVTPVPTSIRKKDRNRTRSIRDKYKLPLRLPLPTISDYLMRKQEFQKGGQRAPIREYQQFYTTIHANLMCFFIDKKDYNELNAATQPINLFNCKLNQLEDTTIQRDVIHIETSDGAEYLFDAAGEENDIENLELWMAKMLESSTCQPLPIFSTYSSNLTNTAHLNISTGDLSSLSAQTTNKPRSRAPVVMTLPPIKTVSFNVDDEIPNNNKPKINLNESNEDYYTQITSPLNKSAIETQRTGTYENVPHLINNSLNNVEETFYQDSTGQINESQTKDSLDQVDIAPFRYRQDPISPTSPLNSNRAIGSISDKVGHLEPSRNDRRLVSIIKKTAQNLQVKQDETRLIRPTSVIAEEGSSESLPLKPADKKESIIAEVLKHSVLNSSQLSADDLRHMSYNQAIQSKQIEREAGVVRNLVESLSTPVNNNNQELNISNISELSEEYDSVSVKLSKQPSNASDVNSYGIRNLVSSEDKRSSTLPSKMSGPAASSELSSKHSFSDEKETKTKRNIFGSIFRKKKGKYDVKSDSKSKDKK